MGWPRHRTGGRQQLVQPGARGTGYAAQRAPQSERKMSGTLGRIFPTRDETIAQLLDRSTELEPFARFTSPRWS